MSDTAPRTILVGTDLTPASDTVVRTAAALARHAGARLHVAHALAAGAASSDELAPAREALDEQLRRVLPAGFEVAGRSLQHGLPHKILEAVAEESAADLLVLGPHGGTALGAHFLGSTADRVLRTSRIPCLVVRSETSFPLSGAGVPVDLSSPSLAALRQACRWVPLLAAPDAGGRILLRLLHVGSPVTRADLPDHEQSTLRPRLAREAEAAGAGAGLEVEIDVFWDHLVPEAVCRWVDKHGLDLLIVGTHGLSGLPRAILGSTATRLARHAPCSVLMVPPDDDARGAARQPALDRVLVGIDFTSPSLDAAGWAARLAPEAELVLAHASEVPRPPAPLRGWFPPHDELVRTALAGAEQRLTEAAAALPQPARTVVRQGRPSVELAGLARELGADLVVVGAHGRWGIRTTLGSTADALLAESPAPVLLAQGFDDLPRHLLVPMDESSDSRDALSWAAFLARRFEARLTVFHVLSTSLLGHMKLVSNPPTARAFEQNARDAVESWLEQEAGATGVPAERRAVATAAGVAGIEILAAAGRLACDLIVLGSRGSGGARTFGLGSVASAIVRKGTGPILVVPPARP